MVRLGAADATLALAVGHVDGTSRPGENGNTVLAGHRDTFFRGLRRIQLDDEVRIVVQGNTYDYRVVSLEVVAATETRVLEPTSDEVLTLVTCYPFHYIGSAPDRFVVRASRLDRPPSGPSTPSVPEARSGFSLGSPGGPSSTDRRPSAGPHGRPARAQKRRPTES